MSELLISLLCSALILLSVTRVLSIFHSFRYESYRKTEDMLGIVQLRLYLAGKQIPLQEEGEELIFHTEDHDRYLRLVNGKIAVQDGLMIFLHDVESLYFYYDNDRFRMTYERNGETEDVWIGFASLAA